MDCSKLCCLASVDGKECKEVFDTYDDFEEHYCQKHLDLTLFACGGKGCTAQFGTILQIFRHLEICKRRGKKMKLLQSSNSVLESLTVLDRAKLLAVQCCVRRAKRANELARINSGITTNSSHESYVQSSLDGMDLLSSLDDDQIHVPIIEPSNIQQMEDGEHGPSILRKEVAVIPARKERAVTPARQAAWRLKEQMLLEETTRKTNKLPGKTSQGMQERQKKLPVKVTDKTRISALITDDPKKTRCTSTHLQIVESSPFRDSTIGRFGASMSSEPTKHIMSAERRSKIPDKIQDVMSAVQKQPRVFESSLPAGPTYPPKIHDVSNSQSSSFELTFTRPPDYSEFLRNPVPHATLHEIPITISNTEPLQISPNSCQNFGNRSITRNTQASQPATFVNSERDVQYKHENTKSHGILQRARIKFSKRMRGCKTFENLKLNAWETDRLEQPAEKTESLKSSVGRKEKVSVMEASKFNDSSSFINMSSDKDSGEEEDEECGKTVPILLNLFSDKKTPKPVLFDPRKTPESPQEI